MRKLLALVAVVALATACGGKDDNDTPAAATPDSTATTGPATTTVDAVAAWCAMSWADVRAEFDSGNPDEGALDRMVEAARDGADLDNPTIAAGSADIVEALTWQYQDPLPPPPDPQLLTDAIVNIGFECDPI
jgi:hypothetical protein